MSHSPTVVVRISSYLVSTDHENSEGFSNARVRILQKKKKLRESLLKWSQDSIL